MQRYRAVFARGGTSKALIFHRADLPADRKDWSALFLAAMGSPDIHGRQLDGMGGGVSSLSKVCIVERSNRPDADVDYTFGQISVTGTTVDYSGNCGNMSSAIGPFAVDEGLVSVDDGQCTIRIFNTNTQRLIHATFEVLGGRAVTAGDCAIPGVDGTGAPVRLDFISPGGATTGKLLPTGHAVDVLEIPGLGRVECSLVDAANACVFVAASDLGLTGAELPDELERRPDILEKLALIRAHGAVAMGLSKTVDEARGKPMLPFIAMVAEPRESKTLSGTVMQAASVDLTVRAISNGQPHRALPLTGSLCVAVACEIEGSLPNRLATGHGPRRRLGMPSGVIEVAAEVVRGDASWEAQHGSFYRTARRLFDGTVCVDEERMAALRALIEERAK